MRAICDKLQIAHAPNAYNNNNNKQFQLMPAPKPPSTVLSQHPWSAQTKLTQLCCDWFAPSIVFLFLCLYSR